VIRKLKIFQKNGINKNRLNKIERSLLKEMKNLMYLQEA